MGLRWGVLGLLLACLCSRAQPDLLRGCIGTYDRAPRLPDGRINIPKLLAELSDLRANTYNFLIAHHTNDWADLHLFLPRAREQGLTVWVTLLPPSESPPRGSRFSEPFRLDFDRWAEALANLSLAQTNLVAWSIDDFLHNEAFFTPELVKRYTERARAINPRLRSVPCWYFRQIRPATVEKYRGLFDGVLFPYRAESDKQPNLTNATLVEAEVQTIRRTVGEQVPVILDVYATAHSRLGGSTPEYVQEVVRRGLRCCDGVLIFCHQDPLTDAAKYQVIRSAFHDWLRMRTGAAGPPAPLRPE